VTVTSEPTGPEVGLTESVGVAVVVPGEGAAAPAGTDEPVVNPATMATASTTMPIVDHRYVTRNRSFMALLLLE
jgi:hypothetical protein